MPFQRYRALTCNECHKRSGLSIPLTDARLPKKGVSTMKPGMYLLLAGWLLAWAPFLGAQTETARISGTVLDPAGAVVPNAKIKVLSLSSGTTYDATSTSAGTYLIANVLPGSYEITVEAQGFSIKKTRLQATVGSVVTLNFALEVGSTTTVVEVAATSEVVNVETQTLGAVVSNHEVLELPSITRNPYAFVVTTGNVSDTDPSGRGVGVAINGQRAASTGILLDGASNTDDFTATVGINVPLDSVQEYSVLTSNFTSEFGRAAGGIVNVATKSGTNEYHGTAYEFNRVSKLTANSFDNNANGVRRPVFTRNQFGFSLGGPVLKDKLFFFTNAEWIRVRSQATRTVFVPSDQLIAAAAPQTRDFFGQLGQIRSGVTEQGSFSKNQLQAQGFNPCGGAAAGGPCAQFDPNLPMWRRLSYSVPDDSGGGTPQNTYLVVGRFDYYWNPKTQLFGRYARESIDTFAGSNADSPYSGFDTGASVKNDSVVVSLVRTFSPTVVGQSKVNFNRLNNSQPLGDRAPSPTLFMRTTRTSILGNQIALPGYLPFSPGTAIPFGGPQNFLQAYQDFSILKGRHQFRFGGNYTYIRDNRTFGAFLNSAQTLGTNFGNAVDNLLRGQLRQFQGAVNPQGKFPCVDPSNPDPTCLLDLPATSPSFSRSNRYHEFALYAQDSWKVAPRFTLNLGVRYEFFGVQRNNRPELESNFFDAELGNIFQNIRNGNVATTPNSPVGGLWRNDWNNFAPRFGFAWDPMGDGKTSVRGGYGIAYERNFGNVTFNVIQNPPNYAVIALVAGADVPSLNISLDNAGPLAGTSGKKALPPVSLRNIDSNIRTAYSHFWSFSVEREFGRGLLAAAEYSGSAGRKLYSLEDPNRVGFGNAFLGDPCTPDAGGGPGDCRARLRRTQFTALNRRSGKGFSNYNGVNFRAQVNNFKNSGLLLRANYTVSKAIDNLSSTFSESNNNFNLGLLDPFNPKLDKGLADFDIRQRFVLSGIWDVPFAKSTSGPLKHVLDGWQFAPIFTARTGSPFTIFDCTNAFFAVCPRAMFDGPVPTGTPDNIAPNGGVPNSFIYRDLSSAPINNSFYNPLTGTAEVGPFPANMSGRNRFKGPGTWNVDLGIYKNFQVTERFKLQFRSEFYSLFNHANLRLLGDDADVSGGNTIISGRKGAGDNRNVQLALKLIF